MEIKRLNEQPKKFYANQSQLQMASGIAQLTTQTFNNLASGIVNEVRRQQQIDFNNSFLEFATQQQIKNSEYKLQNADNPNNQEARNTLNEDYEAEATRIVAEQPSNLRNEASRQFNQYKKQMNAKLDLWAFQQNYANEATRVQQQIDDLLQNAMVYGLNADIDGASDNLQVVGDTITKNATLTLGEPQAKQLLNNLVRDYYTSYLNGLLQTQPEQVLANVDDEKIIQTIGTENANKFRSAAKTRIENIKQYTTDKELSNLLIQNKNITTKAIRGELTLVELNDFFEANQVSKPLREYLLKQGEFKSDRSSTSAEKKTFEERYKEKNDLLQQILMLETNDEEKHNVNNYRELQDKVFELANDGTLNSSEAENLLNRLHTSIVESNVANTLGDFKKRILRKEDKIARGILKEFKDDKYLQYYKLDNKGEPIETETKNIIGNKRVITKELYDLLNMRIINYMNAKYNGVVEKANEKGLTLNEDGTFTSSNGGVYTYIDFVNNWLSNGEYNNILKNAYDRSVVITNNGLGIDTTNRTPQENLMNLNNYNYKLIMESNDALVEEILNMIDG